jgi:hypothetical protein
MGWYCRREPELFRFLFALKILLPAGEVVKGNRGNRQPVQKSFAVELVQLFFAMWRKREKPKKSEWACALIASI